MDKYEIEVLVISEDRIFAGSHFTHKQSQARLEVGTCRGLDKLTGLPEWIITVPQDTTTGLSHR